MANPGPLRYLRNRSARFRKHSCITVNLTLNVPLYTTVVPRSIEPSGMSEATARSLLIVIESFVFGSLWGLIAGGRRGGPEGAFAGAFIGILFAPFAVFSLCRKHHTHVIAIWLGSTSIVTIVLAVAGAGPPGVFLGTAAMYIASAIIARLTLPTILEAIPGHCPACLYDLTGIHPSRCPECGHNLAR